MRKFSFCLLLIGSIVHGATVAPCDDDWLAYKDEKCVKLYKTFADRNQAEGICNQHGATLITIKSADEQKFLTELVTNSSFSNDVWIGAERVPDSVTEFLWSDGSDFELYSNWAVGRPSAETRKTCVQMQSELSVRNWDLEWFDTGCTEGEWFICQKLQNWSAEYLQQAVLSTRRNIERNARRIQFVAENPFPIGFIYVQLQNQPEPSAIWSSMKWTEITSQYAGLFFRVAGGTSAAFGSIQAESSPKLNSVSKSNLSVESTSIALSPGSYSSYISTGSNSTETHWGLRFYIPTAEVRPRNTAMRIWIRT